MKVRFLIIFSIALIGLLAVRGVVLAKEIHFMVERDTAVNQTIRLVDEDRSFTQTGANLDRGLPVKSSGDTITDPETCDDHGQGLEPGDDKGGAVSTLPSTQKIDDKGGLRDNPSATAQPEDDHKQYRDGYSSGYD